MHNLSYIRLAATPLLIPHINSIKLIVIKIIAFYIRTFSHSALCAAHTERYALFTALRMGTGQKLEQYSV